jgi:hypothetical protein
MIRDRSRGRTVRAEAEHIDRCLYQKLQDARMFRNGVKFRYGS